MRTAILFAMREAQSPDGRILEYASIGRRWNPHGRLYEARIWPDGKTTYAVDGQEVPVLPYRVIARDLGQAVKRIKPHAMRVLAANRRLCEAWSRMEKLAESIA